MIRAMGEIGQRPLRSGRRPSRGFEPDRLALSSDCVQAVGFDQREGHIAVEELVVGEEDALPRRLAGCGQECWSVLVLGVHREDRARLLRDLNPVTTPQQEVPDEASLDGHPLDLSSRD